MAVFVPDTARGADRDGFVTRAARCGRAIRFLTRALPGCIDVHLSKSRSSCIRPYLEDSDSESNATRWNREAGRNAYSFYDRLHGNIARCVMLTRQHGSLKHRGNLPFDERVQGERTSVPSSGVGADPHATVHRGGMILRAAEAALPLIADVSAFLPTSISQMNLITRRLAGRQGVGRFRSIIHDENWEGMT